jgi:hypothetical protein
VSAWRGSPRGRNLAAEPDRSSPGPPATHPPRPAYGILARSLVIGEVAESAEGSRLLSGYRGKTSVQGSNPCLSAISLPAICQGIGPVLS